MRKITLVGLVALLAACGGGKDRQLQYGAPQAPTFEEQGAAGEAQASLAGSLAFAPATEPSFGAPGLADQLASSLGGYASAAALGSAPARRVVGRAVGLVIDTGGMDPACVTVTPTAATWTGCVMSMSDVDPVTGDSLDMTATIAGTMGFNAATGTTTWNIGETMAMTMTSDGQAVSVNGTMRLEGSITATATTLRGHSGSSVSATSAFMGMSAAEAYTTTLDLDVGYLADPLDPVNPFCLSGGKLTVEQVWSRRPTGSTPADLPDQGWRFEWTGCGLFTVAHGS
jgi:hypothetical protein